MDANSQLVRMNLQGKFPHVSTCRRVGYANLHFVLSAVSHIVEDPTQPHTAFSGAHIVALAHSSSSPLNTVHGSKFVFVVSVVSQQPRARLFAARTGS